MNFALLIPNLKGDGAQKSVLMLAQALIRAGHHAEVWPLSPARDYEIPKGVTVHEIHKGWRRILARKHPYYAGWSVRRFARHRERKLGRSFDLVIANLIPSSEVVRRAGLRPTVHVLRNSLLGQLKHCQADFPQGNALREHRELLKYARSLERQHVSGVSHGLVDELPTLGVTPASSRAIFNAMDVEGIRRLAREEVPGLPDGPFLLHANRLAHQKRHDLLFSAFTRLRQTHPDLKLVCLSKDSDKLREKARIVGLPDESVLLPGWQHNPYAWMARSKAFVLCSDYEGLPGTLIQALLSGCPSVSTDCPSGPSEIMTGDLARWLIPCNDAEALADKLELILREPPKIDPEHAANLVAPEKIVARYVALAEELAKY
jgi:glycosyltransferase involved in cell wall biosynthesis